MKITLDHIVVIFFALLGFVGSVILYRTNGPPIMTAFFLATGVAALVYGFLGGVQQATFVWGALKLSGTLAALVGVAVGVNYYLQKQLIIDAPVAGRYEWQWAGAGWIGHIDVKKDGTAQMNMSQYRTCSGEVRVVPLLQQNETGKLELLDGGTRLSVNIPVQFIEYDDKCTKVRMDETTVLTGTIDRKPGYAGQIEYSTKYGAPIGDMILVKSFTSGVH